jgi:AbrB family looped-hinge helix DNA binding protein
METVFVSQDGRITIPKPMRELLGIHQGSQVGLAVVGDHVELRVQQEKPDLQASGFGVLKSRKKAVPADFDPAVLLKR